MRQVERTTVDSDDEGEAIDRGDQCYDEYPFIVAAYGYDLTYVPLGTGIKKKVEINGQDADGSSQAVILHKSYQMGFGRNPQALLLGIKFANGAVTPNVTAFGPPLGRRKKQRKPKAVAERSPSWFEEASQGRMVTKVPWCDSLSWLGYDSHRKWSYAVKADGDFDLVAFLSPIRVGLVMFIALIGGKYFQHPDLQSLVGSLSTVMTIVAAFSVAYAYNGSLDHASRLHKSKLVSSPICPYCNTDNETAEHIFWHCTRWNSIRKKLPHTSSLV